MRRGERLFRRLPPRLQDVALTIEGTRVAHRRYGWGFAEVLRAYEERNDWSQGDIEQHRDTRLRLMATHARTNVPHYATDAYRGLDEIEGLADLDAFPVLTKEEVRSLGDRLYPTARIPGRRVGHTSGTTGTSLVIPVGRSAEHEQWAVWWRYRHWHGITRDLWCGYFGGRLFTSTGQRIWRIDRAQRRVMFSSFHTNPGQLDEVVDVLIERQLPWIHGFPSVISLVAGRILDRGLGARLTVRWVTTGAENLLQWQKDLITSAFGVEPREHYGAAEKVANASQCPDGQVHLDEDFGAAEVLDGELVGTALSNPAFPLFRYRTGDLATLGPAGCACGRPGRILTGVDGRLDDYLVLADGGRLGRLDTVIKTLTWVRAAQFIQRTPGLAELLVVAEPGVGALEWERLRRGVLDRGSGGLDLTVREVAEITRTRAGKSRLVISEVDD